MGRGKRSEMSAHRVRAGATAASDRLTLAFVWSSSPVRFTQSTEMLAQQGVDLVHSIASGCISLPTVFVSVALTHSALMLTRRSISRSELIVASPCREGRGMPRCSMETRWRLNCRPRVCRNRTQYCCSFLVDMHGHYLKSLRYERSIGAGLTYCWDIARPNLVSN